MSSDRIQDAIEAGEKNLRTWKLVQNWCANVKIVKHGGTGLVEMQTGLPIGHHFLECPHAPAGGMAAWDLAETALDFYDRNCVDCQFRKPVGLPNISTLVAERDAHKKSREREQARRDQEVAGRLAAREAARELLRRSLDALSATTLDQISELDCTRSDQASKRLVELAELAPETFPSETIEHLFSLADSEEYWLIEPSLKVLSLLSVDPVRLCNTALRALRSYSVREIAAEIVRTHAAHANTDLIAGAVPSLISLASPISSPIGGGRTRQPDKEPILALYKLHQPSIRAAIKSLLEGKNAYQVRTAACGIRCLAEDDPAILEFLPLELVSKLVRAKYLLQGDEDEVTEALDDIRSVVTQTFLKKPKETDALIEQYLAGAASINAAELYKVYDSVLRDLHSSRGNGVITDAHRLAFRRLITVATQPHDEDAVDAWASLFHGEPHELTPLAAAEIDLLLGSAAILSTKLTELDAEKPERIDELYVLERMNRRSHFNNLMHCFIRWSCVAAGKIGENAIGEVLNFMHALPEGSTELRGAIVGCFDALMVSTDALQQCLPDYYSALVGSEQFVRSNAATVMGEVTDTVHNNMPSLVFEAFSALLTDPYIIVHRATVRALERFRLPANLDAAVMAYLSNFGLHPVWMTPA